nr:hypothetical protein [Tanacetum cinerariifolium]
MVVVVQWWWRGCGDADGGDEVMRWMEEIEWSGVEVGWWVAVLVGGRLRWNSDVAATMVVGFAKVVR